jgi:hypothetical protein
MGKEYFRSAPGCKMLGTIGLRTGVSFCWGRGIVLFHTLDVLNNLAIINRMGHRGRHRCLMRSAAAGMMSRCKRRLDPCSNATREGCC